MPNFILKTDESYTYNIDWWSILGIFQECSSSLLLFMQHRINFDDYADDSCSNVEVMKTFQGGSSA